MALPDKPITRQEMYLSNMAGQGTPLPENPITREEAYLDVIAKQGGGGGGTGDGDMKKSVYDNDLAVLSAGGIKPFVAEQTAGKVDKVTGKGLSSNDYTNEEKTIVGGVTDALSAKVDKVEGKGLSDNNYSDEDKAIVSGVTSALSGKVDKEQGKGLSENDYTDEDKAIVDGVTSALALKADKSEIPENTSDLTNDSGFITNTVNNLANYYLKTQTYTQTEVDALIAAVKNGRFISVATLPTTDIDTKAIYLVPSSDPQTGNVKDEYINTDGTSAGWELIGSTAMDLSGYVTDEELTTALADYTTTAGLTTLLSAKQDTISDLATIRSGASAGASAIQPKSTVGLVKNDGTIDTNTYALASALDGKVDKVTGKGLSTNDYDDTEKAKVADAFPRSEQAVTGAVNFLDNKLENATNKGITVVKNSDKTVTVTGTASEAVNFDVNRVLPTLNLLSNLEIGKTYVLKGCPKNGGTQKYSIVMNKKVGENVTYHYDTGDGLEFTYDGTWTSYSIIIQVWPSAGANINLTFKPQIALSENTPYAPYAMTNKELTEKKVDKVSNATNGNFAGLDSNGNLTDSGKSPSDFLPSNTPIPSITNCYQSTDIAETALADDDYFPFYDTSASGKRKTLWSNIKAKLKAFLDSYYNKTEVGYAGTASSSDVRRQYIKYYYGTSGEISWNVDGSEYFEQTINAQANTDTTFTFSSTKLTYASVLDIFAGCKTADYDIPVLKSKTLSVSGGTGTLTLVYNVPTAYALTVRVYIRG